MRRADLRENTAVRQLSCGLGMLKRSDGSGKFDFGSSMVLCGVFGPTQAMLREELVERALISVTFTPLAGSGGTQDRLYEKILGQVAGSLILTSLYPKTVIKITCQVMSQDGSILSSAINAMILALLDSGIPMKATCCAVSCMISKDGDLILDPTVLELEDSISSHSFAFNPLDDTCAVIQSNGMFSVEDFDACYDLCLLACKSIYNFIKAAVSKKLISERGLDK